MPYFKVLQNKKLLANAGLSDISVLSAHVIVGPEGLASLGVHGMRSTKTRYEHFDWISQSLRPGDQVQIAYVASGRPSKPKSRSTREIGTAESVKAELAKLEAQLAEFEARAAAEPPAPRPTWTRAPRPRTLKVSMGSRTVNAQLGDQEHLQAVLNYTKQGCILEVDAMTVLQDGSTKGKRWLRKELRPGQQVRITYAT